VKLSWNRIDDIVSRIEKGLIVLLLGVMVLVAFTQIVMRNMFSTGLSWGEPLVRYLVLWVGFIGAALATRESKHITIELFSVWKSGKPRWYAAGISHTCSAIVCALLAVAAVKFLWFEAQMGASPFFGLPVWVPESIIPIAFVIMSIRFFTKALAVIFNRPQDQIQAAARSDS
jgi:C4-dicarboxylate transporter DctQ subunit